jgi:hypothetical protein
MQKKKMKAYLDATNGGLEIFRKYINTPFDVDRTEVVRSLHKRFKVSYSERYKNYVITIEDWNGLKWSNPQNLNAVWYVKETLGLSENQTYEHIEYTMDLNISIKQTEFEKVEDKAEEAQIKKSKLTENTETDSNIPSLLVKLMNYRTITVEDDNDISNDVETKNEVKTLSQSEIKNKLFRDNL